MGNSVFHIHRRKAPSRKISEVEPLRNNDPPAPPRQSRNAFRCRTSLRAPLCPEPVFPVCAKQRRPGIAANSKKKLKIKGTERSRKCRSGHFRRHKRNSSMPVQNVATVSPNAANTNAFEHTVRAKSFFRTFKIYAYAPHIFPFSCKSSVPSNALIRIYPSCGSMISPCRIYPAARSDAWSENTKLGLTARSPHHPS